MHVELYPELIDLLADFQTVVSQQANTYLWQRQDELPPESFDLSFAPALKTSTVAQAYDESLCVLCERRISYKHNQFTDLAPAVPFLIVLHNAFLTEDSKYYHNPKHNQMYEKIIHSVTGVRPDQFLTRELLRCHFGAEDVKNQSFVKNCLKHLREDINQFGLRGVLVMGQAAQLLFDKEELGARVARVTELFGTPLVVTPGPSRLVYMQSKGFSQDKILEEKRKIFAAVKLFKNDVMQLPD